VIAKIFVTPKRTVLDPQGQVVQKGLHNLGYEDVGQVHVGKFIVVELDDAAAGDREAVTAQVDEMCRRFLANPIIEDYRFELVEG
jgi:phosphoribosylformylglycinamidine synthase